MPCACTNEIGITHNIGCMRTSYHYQSAPPARGNYEDRANQLSSTFVHKTLDELVYKPKKSVSAAPEFGAWRRRRPHRQLPQVRQLKQMRVHVCTCREIQYGISQRILGKHVKPQSPPPLSSPQDVYHRRHKQVVARTCNLVHDLLYRQDTCAPDLSSSGFRTGQ